MQRQNSVFEINSLIHGKRIQVGLFSNEKEQDINWKQELFAAAKGIRGIEATLIEFGKDLKEQKYSAHSNKKNLEEHIINENEVFKALQDGINHAGNHCSKADVIDAISKHSKAQNGKIDRIEIMVATMSAQQNWKRQLIADAIKYLTLSIALFGAMIAYLRYVN